MGGVARLFARAAAERRLFARAGLTLKILAEAQRIEDRGVDVAAGPGIAHAEEPERALRVVANGRVIVDRKRDHGVILGLHKQGWNADVLQKLIGRLMTLSAFVSVFLSSLI